MVCSTHILGEHTALDMSASLDGSLVLVSYFDLILVPTLR